LGLLEAGKEVHAASQKFGFYDDVYVASSLINVYVFEVGENGAL